MIRLSGYYNSCDIIAFIVDKENKSAMIKFAPEICVWLLLFNNANCWLLHVYTYTYIYIRRCNNYKAGNKRLCLILCGGRQTRRWRSSCNGLFVSCIFCIKKLCNSIDISDANLIEYDNHSRLLLWFSANISN